MAKRPKPASAPRAAQAADATVSVAGTILRVIGTIFLILLVTGLLFLCIFAYYVKNCLSTDLDVQLSDFTVSLSSSILYEDADGNWQNLTNLSSTENRVWVDYADIPKDMEHAAVAIEDKRFYKHKGVDWYRTTGAFINMFLSMKNDFGGSTITQQLIKNLTKQDDITVQRKLLEIFQALEFEKSYDKEEIMEWYLNIVYFGEGCNGVYTAAETYFGKEPKDLTLAECASIIGITNNPSKYDPFISRENNKTRQETILKQMYEQGWINKEQYDEAVAQELVFVRSESDERTQTIYSYYAEAVINDVLNDLVEQKGVSRDTARTLLYSGGYQVYSCYDPSIQQAIDDVYTNLDNMPQRPSASGQQFESAIVIMDPYTGEIKGLSGGTGEKTINFGTNRATQSKRPPGSSIKPIATYGPAMELGLITQYTQVNDAADIKLTGTSWYPKNSGGGNYGVITIREALQRSLNTVSAQILDKLTEIDSSIRRKIKQQLIVIKGVFCIDQLHLQFMLADLFLTDLECLMLFFFILPFQLLVILRRHTNDRFQRLDHLLLIHLADAKNHLSELDSAGGLHDHMVAHLDFHLRRIEVIYLSGLAEPDSDYLYHKFNSPSSSKASAPAPNRC